MTKPPIVKTDLNLTPDAKAALITTMEAAEVLGLSVATFQKRLAGENAGLAPKEKQGKANMFDLDEVIAYGATIQPRQRANKPDPMVRMNEIAAAYLARNVPVWVIFNKKSRERLGVLPGKTIDQAEFNAKRRFKDVDTFVQPYEAPKEAQTKKSLPADA